MPSYVDFAQGESSKIFTVTVLSDTLPENAESIRIRLVNATLTFSPSSSYGAPSVQVSPSAANLDLVIQANDFASGIIQFTNSDLYYDRTAGAVRINVTRTAGAFGIVAVDWLLTLETAVFGVDVLAAPSGSLVFADGVRSQQIDAMFVNSTDPQLEKTFQLSLENVTGGVPDSPPSLGGFASATVHIRENSDVYGVYSFALASLSTVVSEGSSVVLTVVREIGFERNVTVTWSLVPQSLAAQVRTGGCVLCVLCCVVLCCVVLCCVVLCCVVCCVVVSPQLSSSSQL